MDKKKIVFGLIGMALSAVLYREVALVFMRTFDDLLIVFLVLIGASFSVSFATLMEGTPLAKRGDEMFREREEADHERGEHDDRE